MVKRGSRKKFQDSQNASVAADMLNFHFASSLPEKEETGPRLKRNTKGRNKHDMQRYNRSQEERSCARRKASSSMFHLHSSPDHAFVLSRIAKQGYTFSGPDVAVLWESVRAVKYLAPSSTNQVDTPQESCPICLDSFTCARITKCGHSFCYPCLLRHFQSSASTDATAVVKCPCCSLPIYIDDIRPVLFETVQSPKTQTKMKFVKLHRCKNSPTPYLPQRGQWKRSAPYSAPSMTDKDKAFSRFNYIDPVAYVDFLKTNQTELENYGENIKNIEPSGIELFFITMSIERVQQDIRAALGEMDDEQSLLERFKQEQAGIYQNIPDSLFFSRAFEGNTGTKVSASAIPEKQAKSAGCKQNSRKLSIGSEGDKRPRGKSIGSETSCDTLPDTPDSGHRKFKGKSRTLPASLYLTDDEYQFYQSTDGQMCFLSKFNMNCLTHEFSTHAPILEPSTVPDTKQLCSLSPLPDLVEGTIIEIESVHLTPEMRKRMPFLSHLPLYTDISFIELDLNPILSTQTKCKFKAEYEKRKSRRKKTINAEKKTDRKNRKKEEERIQDLKARFQGIDPNDEFFQTVLVESEQVTMGESFGPSITGEQNPVISSYQSPVDNPVSFRAVMDTPSSMAMTEDSFPTLGSGNNRSPVSDRPWRAEKPLTKGMVSDFQAITGQTSSSPRGKKLKKKKKQTVLFSTGGSRGGGY